MLKIGITGGIGSGKSTVCKVFALLGVPIYYADEEAKKLLNYSSQIKESVVNQFGIEIIDDDGLIDRRKLAALVFNDREKLQQLNNIIHPAVVEHFDEWLIGNKTAPYILKEAAILFESASNKGIDKAITVIAPLALKIKRTIKRDGVTEEQVNQRMSHQLSDEEKIKRSDFIIYNNEQQLLIPQIISIHKQLKPL